MVPRIQTLQELAREAKCAGLAEEAERLAEQARAGGYFVACLGQFKRGKSSLLNALLGKAVLPTGVAPVTSVATVIRFGPEAGARVRFAGGPGWQGIPRAAIADYVTEERNPGNEKGVRAVEIFEPARRLAAGMCLVDTPGIGSVILENTEATRAFVPRIDAALVVLGGDPPISGEELELVRQVAEHVDRFVFVLNKADRLSEAELAEARAFNLRTLERSLVGAPVELLDVSAAEHLSGRGPTRDWRRLEAWLDDLSSTSGPRLAAEAAQRGARRVASQLAALLEEQRLALVRPVAESEARVARLGTVVAAAEQSLGTLSVAFLAEEERLRHALEDQRQRFLARALPAAHASLAEALRPGHGRAGRRRQEAMRTAEAVARRWIETWVEQEVPEAEARYREAFGRLVVMAVDFLSRAAQQPGLERLGRESEFDVGFRVSSHRYFTDLLHLTMASPLDWLLDLGLPAAVRRRSIRRHAERYLERLMEANSSRVQFDLDERVRESGRKLEQEVRARLRDVLTISASALESARRTTSAGAAAVQAELARLELLARRARALDTPTPGETPR